ncbi:hypothetical protein DRP43_01130 [candidate division TA06 bacterium]|uniref:histidine kinase n=1 Tax=candidate division TA06 bacterium TaxID=2250710 RepID=A0A660SP99_UNCT6|nr:MAG: hypothetical protein DRP43_01130 [candidate division TA06 bacterium]
MINFLKSLSRLEKIIFIFFIILLISFIIFIQIILTSLEENTKLKTRVYARFISSALNEDNDQSTEIIFDEIISKIDFPVLITDGDDIPVSWRNINIGDESITYSSLKKGENVHIIRKFNTIKKRLAKSNTPVEIYDPISGEVIERIYFGYPKEVFIMRYVPLFEILVMLILSILGFIGIKIIKENENNKLWMGLAREMAHQIGTPTIALLGWIELIEENHGKLAEITDIEFMKEDVNKLKIIANRFNKIGRAQNLICLDLNKEVDKVVQYFNERSPKRGKGYSIKIDKNENVRSKIDTELFGWAIENVIKNSIDAISQNGNKIKIDMFKIRNRSIIEISDNGRGINMRMIDNIFQPGFSTKKYGWGLGLTLTKRIIKDYFAGKIFVKNTKKDKGTTFRIDLPYCEV